MSDQVIFFSPSTCGAYQPSLNGEDIPDDVLEVPLGYWQDILHGLSVSPKKVAARQSDGYPILVDPPPLSAEELADNERIWRDVQLAGTDSLVVRHRDEQEEGVATTLSTTQYAELQTYRRTLRNWPEAGEFPLSEHRPAAPSWMSEHTQ
ncbi:phage tail assembly chaperone [Pseudomonas sp. TH31]|uniref:phage tail assembly chaperone n=1 Tax=Pseudomonas sp. TH31 TaxID=2796396 RepID=UPI001914C307|nr:phage tail assembly chaperone [Pseudomonas sp. TH31]MBK5416879.1 hypothetical protein [Pseudomonas sp. TH31]